MTTQAYDDMTAVLETAYTWAVGAYVDHLEAMIAAAERIGDVVTTADRLLGDRHRLQPFELIALNDLGNAAIRVEALRQCNPSKWPFGNGKG